MSVLLWIFLPLICFNYLLYLESGNSENISKEKSRDQKEYPLGEGPLDLSSEYINLLFAERIREPTPNSLEQ